jgi:hypothetical protein
LSPVFFEGEGMSEVCREFGISRKTGDKILVRYIVTCWLLSMAHRENRASIRVASRGYKKGSLRRLSYEAGAAQCTVICQPSTSRSKKCRSF